MCLLMNTAKIITLVNVLLLHDEFVLLVIAKIIIFVSVNYDTMNSFYWSYIIKMLY